MNIYEALKLVGHYPVVEGWPRTICFVIGFLGMMAWLAATILLENAGFNLKGLAFGIWMLVLVFFTVMHVLPIYVQ